MESETYIKLSEDEMQRRLEQAANLGARYAHEELQQEIEKLRKELRTLAVTQDVVPEHVLLAWLDVSRDTLQRWDVPVDSRKGHTRLYHVPTVIEHLRSGSDEQKQLVENFEA